MLESRLTTTSLLRPYCFTKLFYYFEDLINATTCYYDQDGGRIDRVQL